ncbi:hypothetical protein B1C78_07740 [Thioalkalivibrio denitrificans]|uniref:Uncharacterized protein n=1 Tax=Thioalkalivibrio denitrificans TaxID=108003 RepID=A0A1V3NIT0_9GAMM|nr:hypothetical protein [Thioalkalivibrio denitrificans]OOG24955.1 hypothetical protein B1C78_07740 [Thioalkalivibrio denitrificans]
MRAGTNPWPFIRIAALCVVILVMGLAGPVPGLRTAGGMLVVFAGLQLVRRYRRTQAACEVSGQLPVAPAVLMAAAQAGIGLVLLLWPDAVLRLLGV